MKKPKPLYASKPRFGLGSLVALVFVAAFGIAAIVFGMNALQGNTPAAPAQPAAFTLDVTLTAVPTETDATQAATIAPTIMPTAAATDAPIEVPAVVPVVATIEPTMSPAATATAAPTLAPSPTAGKPTATPRPTKTPAPTATAAATNAPLGTGETVTYTVKSGDTCGAVAKRLGVTVAQIIQQNKLDDRCFLNVNQVLKITK